MSIALSWGAKWFLPEDAVAAWGCRAILERGGGVDVIQDRADVQGDKGAIKELQKFFPKAAKKLRKWAETVDPASGDVFVEEQGQCVLKATPNRSYGYLYIVAFVLDDAEAYRELEAVE